MTVTSGEFEHLSEYAISVIKDGVGYYVNDGSIYSLNPDTSATETVFQKNGENYYRQLFDITDKYIYVENSRQSDDFRLYRIDRETKEKDPIAICSYYD